MNPFFANEMPPAIRRRSELIGCLGGVLCLPFAIFGSGIVRIAPAGGARVVLPMVFFSTMAGVFACFIERYTQGKNASTGPRAGTRAGTVTALLGGGLTVFATTLHALGIEHADPDGLSFPQLDQFIPSGSSFLTLLVVILGIPPSIFFGMSGAFMTAMICTRCRQAANSATPFRLLLRKPENLLFTFIVSLSAAGLLSPFIISFLIKPKTSLGSTPKPAPAVNAFGNLRNTGQFATITRTYATPTALKDKALPPNRNWNAATPGQEQPLRVMVADRPMEAPTPTPTPPTLSTVRPNLAGVFNPFHRQTPTSTPNPFPLLTKFIYEHHAKSSRGDVDGLVSDYADWVDHFEDGMVDRAYIRKDELEYHAPGTRVTESLWSSPSIFAIGPNAFTTAYPITFERVHPDRRWTRGTADIQMQIEITPTGPQIYYQRARNHDVQKGRY